MARLAEAVTYFRYTYRENGTEKEQSVLSCNWFEAHVVSFIYITDQTDPLDTFRDAATEATINLLHHFYRNNFPNITFTQ